MVKDKKKTKKKTKKRAVIGIASKPPRNKKGQLIAGWGKGSRKLSRQDKKKEAAAAKVLRAKNGRLLPGAQLNPTGSGRSQVYRSNLMAAIREVENDKGTPWLEDLIKRSYKDSQLAIAILGRLYPQMKAIEMSSTLADSMEDNEAEEIRKEFKKRFA